MISPCPPRPEGVRVDRVVTPRGVYVVGSVDLPRRGELCSGCGAWKVRPLPEAQGDGTWCSGCGRREWR